MILRNRHIDSECGGGAAGGKFQCVTFIVVPVLRDRFYIAIHRVAVQLRACRQRHRAGDRGAGLQCRGEVGDIVQRAAQIGVLRTPGAILLIVQFGEQTLCFIYIQRDPLDHHRVADRKHDIAGGLGLAGLKPGGTRISSPFAVVLDIHRCVHLEPVACDFISVGQRNIDLHGRAGGEHEIQLARGQFVGRQAEIVDIAEGIA